GGAAGSTPELSPSRTSGTSSMLLIREPLQVGLYDAPSGFLQRRGRASIACSVRHIPVNRIVRSARLRATSTRWDRHHSQETPMATVSSKDTKSVANQPLQA